MCETIIKIYYLQAYKHVGFVNRDAISECLDDGQIVKA